MLARVLPVLMNGNLIFYQNGKHLMKSRGLHKLCQDPTHYDMDTLEIPGSCRGFKNYKKVVVKKLLTPIKQNYYQLQVLPREELAHEIE